MLVINKWWMALWSVVVGVGALGQSGPARMQWWVPQNGVAKGEVKQYTLESKMYGHARKMSIYTPAGYSASGAQYDVAYFFDAEDYISEIGLPATLDNLIAAKKIKPIVVVLVDNSDSQNVDTTGAWPATSERGDHQGYDYATHAPAVGDDAFTWRLNVTRAGAYEVFVRYPQGEATWGTTRVTQFLAFDTLALSVGFGTPFGAADWAGLHMGRQLELQARFTDGRTFAGFKGSAQLPFLADFDLKQTLEDYRAVIVQGIPDPQVRTRKVFCGGHSLGGLLTGLLMSWDFDGDPKTNQDATVFIDAYKLSYTIQFGTLIGSASKIPSMIHDLAVGAGTEAALEVLNGVFPPAFNSYGLQYGVMCREWVGRTNLERVSAAGKRIRLDLRT